MDIFAPKFSVAGQGAFQAVSLSFSGLVAPITTLHPSNPQCLVSRLGGPLPAGRGWASRSQIPVCLHLPHSALKSLIDCLQR